MNQATLCFVFQGNPYHNILLGTKKRGFGKGKVDGFGGKIQAGEKLVETAVRELSEETGLITTPDDLSHKGVLTFLFPYKPEWDQEVHVFIAHHWQGFPSESEEMRPEWFPINQIPFDQMWDDTRYWLPKILSGERIQAVFTYNQDNETVENYTLQVL